MSGEETDILPGSNLWLEQHEDQAEQVLAVLDAWKDALQELPPTADEARKQLAMEKFSDIFGLAVPNGLSREQFKAAYLIGRGLQYEEVADLLGISYGHLCSMMTEEFKATVRHWRRRTLEDYFAVLMREIDWLVETLDVHDNPGLVLKLVRELKDVALLPEESERWSKEIEIREREVAAKEREVDTYQREVGLGDITQGVRFEVELAEEGERMQHLELTEGTQNE